MAVALDHISPVCAYLHSRWEARVFQHELDHLDGIMYTERATMSSFTPESQLETGAARVLQDALKDMDLHGLQVQPPGMDDPVDAATYLQVEERRKSLFGWLSR